MNSKERRRYIEELLIKSNEPQKGSTIAKELGLTRQVIVKDIAILRAEGKNIIATPEGYIMPKQQKTTSVRRILALSHKPEEIQHELECIVKFGGIIQDVIVEHPLYGEIKGMLMIKNLYDIQNFMDKLKKVKAEPLSILTGGVHLHTIEAENEEMMNIIIKELKEKGYLVSD